MKAKEFTEGKLLVSTINAEKTGSSLAVSLQQGENGPRIQLPVPHPLDFDWRFSEASLRLLLDYMESLSVPTEQVAFLGTPTVLRAALESRLSRHYVLLEANEAVLRSFKAASDRTIVVKCDLFVDPLPPLSSRIVIADAPWYEDYTQVFLWAASRLCQVGGVILLSKPPIGTRPGIEAEWTRTLQLCDQLGLALRDLQERVLEYVSPPFERNALRAGAQPDVGPLWRKGDLAILDRIHGHTVERPRSGGLFQAWGEQELRGVRWRIRKDTSTTFVDPRLVSILPGDILPTVSRRDRRRNLADVWTSGNRIFKCDGRRVFKRIVGALREHVAPSEAVASFLRRKLTLVERQQVWYAERQIEEIVNSELCEYLLAWQG